MSLDDKTQRHLKEFKPMIESISRTGIVLIFFLLIVIAWGVYALIVQLTKGQAVTGMRDYAMWGIYDVNFIFFIGISYAGALISGILHLLRVPWRSPIIRMAETITVVSTIIGPCYIFLSMGRLDRLQHLFMFGRIQSPIIWDVIAISTYLSGSIIFLYLATIRDMALLRDNPVQKWKWRNRLYKFFSVKYHDTMKQRELLNISTDLLSIVIIPLAILVHSVLAWIFGMTLRPGWHSTIFAPYFVVAAVYSGTGMLIVVMWIFRKIYHLESYITKIHFKYLGFIMIILGALYGYFTFSEYLTSWYGSIKWDMAVLYRLFDPHEYWYTFVFAAFVGVLLPIVIVGIPRFRNINSITFAAFIAVIALWVKRYLIIIPTLETPLLPVHDLRPEYVNYSATWVEWSLTAMGVAIFILFFLLFSKFVPILTVSSHGEEKEYSRLRKKVFERQMNRLVRIRKKSDATIIPLILVFLTFSFGTVMAQDESTAGKTNLKLDYYNQSGLRKLVATLKTKIEGKYKPVEGMTISFDAVSGKEKKDLGTALTSDKGKATIDIPEEIFSTGGEKGVYTFEANFAGTKEFLTSSGTTAIKNAGMEISFAQKDSVKSIVCKVFEKGMDGKTINVNDLKVSFYVPRTFSLLKVGEGTLADGMVNVDFPVTLPGDSAGFLTIVAKIEDDETFGNIEASGGTTWGKPLPPEKIVHRGLGDTNAPLWMVYTLIVLLSVVWFHFLYVIFTIFRIRFIGKRAERMLKQESVA